MSCSSCQYCLGGNCHNNCQGTDTSCGCTSCTNCNNSDGWVDVIGFYRPYCDGDKVCRDQKQEYRDYSCWGGSCSYSVTDTRISKSCTECSSGKVCSEICFNKIVTNICVDCLGTDTSCGCFDCVDCNKLDGWVNVGKPYGSDFIPGGGFYFNQEQEYRDYYCSGASCGYRVTETRTQRTWIKSSPLYIPYQLPKDFGKIYPFDSDVRKDPGPRFPLK